MGGRSLESSTSHAGDAPDGQGAISVVSINSYDKFVTPSLNANSENGGVDWFNSGPPLWGRGRAITKIK